MVEAFIIYSEPLHPVKRVAVHRAKVLAEAYGITVHLALAQISQKSPVRIVAPKQVGHAIRLLIKGQLMLAELSTSP